VEIPSRRKEKGELKKIVIISVLKTTLFPPRSEIDLRPTLSAEKAIKLTNDKKNEGRTPQKSTVSSLRTVYY